VLLEELEAWVIPGEIEIWLGPWDVVPAKDRKSVVVSLNITLQKGHDESMVLTDRAWQQISLRLLMNCSIAHILLPGVQREILITDLA
jgi:hypothetical protein